MSARAGLFAWLLSLALGVALGAPLQAQEPAGESPRPALAALERALDRALVGVAPPSPFAMLAGPDGSHGFRLSGQGAFFAVPARRLPGHQRRNVFVFRQRLAPRVQELEARVEAIQRQAELANREAEQAYRDVERQLHIRMGLPPDSGEPLPGGEAPPEPPWHFWFEADAAPEPPPDPQALFAAVREAVVSALESEAGRLPMLGRDEFVAVAVDFVADPFFASGAPQHTLIVRAQQADLEARRAGRIDAAQLRARIRYEEY